MKEDNCMMFIKVLFTLMLVTMVSAGCKGHTGRPKSKTDIDTSRLELIKVKEKEILIQI